VHENELESRRVDGDTASRVTAIDTSAGSRFLELHLTRYEPGRSLPRRLDGVQEIVYAASGRGTMFVEGEEHDLEPGTGVYLASGESYEVENPGPEELLTVSAIAPQTNGATLVEVGCRDMTQFYGVIAPGRAPDHSHVYDEVIYVLEGEGVLHGDGADKPVSAGSCIHLPPLFVHSLENSGDAPMRIVAVFHPAGDPASRAYEANE
jgi:mannose-6-phosphate isomerase-like protein (cupin superfamily)